MNDLIKTEFFVLMNEKLQEITNEEMQRAYGKFITLIDTISQVGNDLTGIIRKLNITRIELLFLSTQNQYEQGKKCV
jgi:translation initiation factor 1 (eIF-1/SUI1)